MQYSEDTHTTFYTTTTTMGKKLPHVWIVKELFNRKVNKTFEFWFTR
jgi:hypothetical protein